MRDAAVADLVTQPPQGIRHDLVVIEGERARRVRVEPGDVLGRITGCLMGSALGVHVVGPQECPIDDRHDARGGAIDVSERVELLQIARRQARCLGEGT